MKDRFVQMVALALVAVGCGDDDAGAGSGEGTVKVQVSGEDAGVDGFLFPSGSEVTLADGWELTFDHVLVGIGRVTLSESPDLVPTDQSMIGADVAELRGPFIVDLAQDGGEVGAGGEGTAVLLGRIDNQTLAGGAGFSSTDRYALGYEVVAASDGAARVNAGADAEPYIARMVAEGYSVMYVGTATFKGTTCESGDDAYFATFPTEVPFELGFATPTSFVNCQNQENQGEPFDGEEYPRGVAIPTQGEALVQLTFHLEHPFYSDVEHEPAIYFDQLAAGVAGEPADTTLTLEALAGVDPTALTDATGAALPWRVCDGGALPPGAQRGFEVGSVPVDPSDAPADALRDYRDYVHYVQSTQGHLNGGEGLCFVRRNYPSPP